MRLEVAHRRVALPYPLGWTPGRSRHLPLQSATRTGRLVVAVPLVAALLALTGVAVVIAGDRPNKLVGLRFGIYPGGPVGTTGPIGSTDNPVPENPGLRLAALEALRPRPTQAGRRPFVVHLYDAFTGQPGLDAFSGDGPNGAVDRQIKQYLHHGFLVELVLRYEPVAASGDGQVPAFAAFVRRAVMRYAAGSQVAFLQVANEANVTGSPGSSDGAYPGAFPALVAGLEAAASQAARERSSMQVGFNWAYDQSPSGNRAFWSYLGDQGIRWRKSVQWVGLDDYPGTFSRPGLHPPQTGPALVQAVADTRQLMGLAGLGPSIPLHISEIGYPTGPGRSNSAEVTAMRSMIDALYRVRGRFDVTDVRWFDLRDSNSSSPNLEENYGLMAADYTPKPAFFTYKRLVSRFSLTLAVPGGR